MTAARCDVLGCECGCHRRKQRQIPRLWTPGMDRELGRGLDRGEHVCTIARAMHLTEESVRWRVKQLGRSLRDGWRSRQEVAAVLGVSRRAVDRWASAGQLRVTRHGTRWTRVADEDLQSFVAAHAGVLFDARAVTDATLRRLAETGALVASRRGTALWHGEK